MGTLQPGAVYVYERVGNQIFARKFGESQRSLIGYYPDSDSNMQSHRAEIWAVLTACETDPAMRDLLDQLFVLYRLKKTHERSTEHSQ